MASVSTDESKIKALLERGVQEVYPSKEYLEKLLKSGKQLRLYLGIDPTGPTLHIGHAIPLTKLAEFQALGHKVVLLIGSFTAMIGDPDKSSTRIPLTKDQVKKNMRSYLKQASKIINTKSRKVFELRYNDAWLAKMKFEDVLALASKMTVQQIIERDLFDKRIKEGKPLYMHELMYPLMQGYDSIALDVDGEIGGNDQTFNMLTGRTLMKEIKNKEKFVLTTKLLTDPTGVKMGKSEGNMITLTDTPEEMYGKVMSWTDGMIISGFELCTKVSMEEITKYKKELESQTNPKNLKMLLAKKVVTLYHDESKAEIAEKDWIQKFEKNEIPTDAEEIVGTGLLMPILLGKGIVESNSEARRLFEGGAITDMTENKKMTVKEKVQSGHVYKIGKHRFIKIK